MGPPLSKSLFGSSFEFGVWELGGQGWILEFGVGVVGLAAMARSLGWVCWLGLQFRSPGWVCCHSLVDPVDPASLVA
jgi:hypothetical protein